MKLAITKTAFPFGVKATPKEDGFSVCWFNQRTEDHTGVDLNEAYIRERCGVREITDASNIYIEMDLTGNITAVHNKMASTLIEKSNGYEYALKNNTLIAAQIYIPFSDSPISDWTLRINGNPAIGVEVPANTPEVWNSLQSFHDFAETIYPSIKVLSIQPLELDCFEITAQLLLQSQPLTKSGVRLFATAETGYLNQREVYTDAKGQARIKARRLDLNRDDKMRVEFGFKYNKNICYADIPQP